MTTSCRSMLKGHLPARSARRPVCKQHQKNKPSATCKKNGNTITHRECIPAPLMVPISRYYLQYTTQTQPACRHTRVHCKASCCKTDSLCLSSEITLCKACTACRSYAAQAPVSIWYCIIGMTAQGDGLQPISLLGFEPDMPCTRECIAVARLAKLLSQQGQRLSALHAMLNIWVSPSLPPALPPAPCPTSCPVLPATPSLPQSKHSKDQAGHAAYPKKSNFLR